MYLYIANCTKQDHDFLYRIPENPSVRLQRIPMGQQIRISGDLSQVDVDAIIKQHERYGLIPADKVSSQKQFIGMCYSIGSPVSLNTISGALLKNNGYLEDMGKQIRKEAAVAVSGQLDYSEQGGPKLQRLDLSFAETKKNSEPELIEGISVIDDKARLEQETKKAKVERKRFTP
jgi:hypothetical protein